MALCERARHIGVFLALQLKPGVSPSAISFKLAAATASAGVLHQTDNAEGSRYGCFWRPPA